MKSGILLCSAALLAATFMTGQQTAFGPKDGEGLPPTDIDRLSVGSPAPDFTLESREGRAVSLSDYHGKKNVVLVFYRGHW